MNPPQTGKVVKSWAQFLAWPGESYVEFIVGCFSISTINYTFVEVIDFFLFKYVSLSFLYNYHLFNADYFYLGCIQCV